ncbi:TatD family hydrolase [Treponema pedis]|uniref:TatD family hydrolase n=1 Tax=Treponema pedis TaxID=409322 RepID=UPI0003FB62DE|nr:TatD family hydrolase [Treponema pedis]
MFSDSHAHIFSILQKNGGNPSFLKEMQDKGFKFLMDIGTEPGDLKKRREVLVRSFGEKIPEFIRFAAGLWPHALSIAEPEKSIKALKADINTLLAEKPEYCALGECGLDRYWNGHAAENNTEEEKGTADTEGEEFLFKEQLKFAREKNLPVIVHSRAAFEETLACIDEIGYHKGIIHCYSYGIEEAKEFIKRGWYISFSGNITYPKKNYDKEKAAELIRCVPENRLLLETDSPYLAPSPFRGKLNTPLLIEYVYAAVSEILGKNMQTLAEQIYNNCCECFAVKTA